MGVKRGVIEDVALWVEEEVSTTSRRRSQKTKETTSSTSETTRTKATTIERARPAGVQLTERDLDVLGWIADQQAVRTDVIRWLLGNATPLSDSRTRAVVARWQRAGVAESRRFFAGAPHVVWLSRTGMALVRPGWRAKAPALPMLAHHHAVSQLRLAIERRGHGSDWVPERVLYKQRPTPDTHVADGTFRSRRGPVTAVEVELTLKSADRLRDIIRDLTLDHEAVLYVVADSTIGRAVTAAAEAVGEAGRVTVADLARVVLDA